jgi:hypothetical protein
VMKRGFRKDAEGVGDYCPGTFSRLSAYSRSVAAVSA